MKEIKRRRNCKNYGVCRSALQQEDVSHERECSRALGANFSRDKRHQKINRSFCFENAIIYWNLRSLLFTVAAFTLGEASLSKFLFIEFSLTFKKKVVSAVSWYMFAKRNYKWSLNSVRSFVNSNEKKQTTPSNVACSFTEVKF